MNEEHPPQGEAGISQRTMEYVVAALLFVFGAIIIYDSQRLGASWGSDGPQSGYFPFYIGLLICLSAVATALQVLVADYRARSTSYRGAVAQRTRQFVSWPRQKQVMAVLVPSAVYVLFVQFIGIYVSSVVFIALFMVWLGKYSWLKSIVVSVLVMAAMFAMFEIWFKVPLWKGIYNPLAFLGY